MHIWTAIAAGGTSHRLNPGAATVRSRSRKESIGVGGAQSGLAAGAGPDATGDGRPNTRCQMAAGRPWPVARPRPPGSWGPGDTTALLTADYVDSLRPDGSISIEMEFHRHAHAEADDAPVAQTGFKAPLPDRIQRRLLENRVGRTHGVRVDHPAVQIDHE